MEQRLKEIAEREAKATPGPWGACLGSGLNQCTAIMNDDHVMICDFLPDWLLNRENEDRSKGSTIRQGHIADLVFVEHARQDIPYLLSALSTLEQVNKGMREALGQLPPDDDQYYVCDSRGVTGNCMMFWRKGNAGYTYNLDDCRIWTKTEAFRQHESRETDIPYLKRDVDALAERHLDVQDLRSFESKQSPSTPEASK